VITPHCRIQVPTEPTCSPILRAYIYEATSFEQTLRIPAFFSAVISCFNPSMRFAVQRTLRSCVVVSTRRLYHASVLPSLISPSSPEFTAKSEAMDTLIHDVEAKMAEARQGGGPKAANRMRSQGKKLPRERYVRAPIHAFWTRK
jgi:hypothetical protein